MAGSSTPAHYAPLTHIRQVYAQTVPTYDYGALGQAGFVQWQADLRAKVADLLGGSSAPRGDLAPQVLETSQKDGYVQQKVEITSEPGVRLPLYVLTPDERASALSHGDCACTATARECRKSLASPKASRLRNTCAAATTTTAGSLRSRAFSCLRRSSARLVSAVRWRTSPKRRASPRAARQA